MRYYKLTITAYYHTEDGEKENGPEFTNPVVAWENWDACQVGRPQLISEEQLDNELMYND